MSGRYIATGLYSEVVVNRGSTVYVYSRTSLIRIEPDQTPFEYMKFPDYGIDYDKNTFVHVYITVARREAAS